MTPPRIALLLLLLAPAALRAQNTQNTPGIPQPNPNTPDSSQNNTGTPDAGALRDKIFLRKAALDNLSAIQLAQLATEKASNPDVKLFAAKLLTDHTTLNTQLRPFADSLGVRTPTTPTHMDQQQYDKLATLTGPDFDREYLNFLLIVHRQQLHAFRDETFATSDPDLKEAVAKALTTLTDHTRTAEKLAAAEGVQAGVPVPR